MVGYEEALESLKKVTNDDLVEMALRQAKSCADAGMSFNKVEYIEGCVRLIYDGLVVGREVKISFYDEEEGYTDLYVDGKHAGQVTDERSGPSDWKKWLDGIKWS